MRPALLLALSLPLLSVACSSSTETTPPSGPGPDGTTPLDPGPNGAAIGPILIEPGIEKTVCVNVRMNNAEALQATKLVADLAPGSHHLIVYRSKLTEEDTVAKECGPFGNVLAGDEVPIMIVQKAGVDELVFPQGTGLELAPNQMLKLEAHYINTTPEPIYGSGILRAEGVPPDGELQQVDLAFWGTADISIPGNSEFTTPVVFQTALEGTTGFAATTHQHRFGTRARLWYAQDGSAPETEPLAENLDWSEPALFPMAPPIAFDGTDGLAFQCEWKNTQPKLVTFGESALQEMCFIWMYYYPSRGFDLCLDGVCVNRD